MLISNILDEIDELTAKILGTIAPTGLDKFTSEEQNSCDVNCYSAYLPCLAILSKTILLNTGLRDCQASFPSFFIGRETRKSFRDNQNVCTKLKDEF